MVPTILMIVASATTLSFGTTTIKAQAQNAATPEQIKDYLTQAIQAGSGTSKSNTTVKASH